MFIYCDESGSFKVADATGSWCVVSTYVLAESQRSHARQVLKQYKRRAGATYSEEVKRSDSTEGNYLQFLDELASVGGFAAAIATDSGRNHGAADNRDRQVQILAAAEAGAYDERLAELRDLQKRLIGLAPQLYVEYGCRLQLAWRTIRLSILYFSRFFPAAMSYFRWRIDEKPPRLKDVYQQSIPGFLEALAMDTPLQLVNGGDYGALRRYALHDDGSSAMDDAPRSPIAPQLYDMGRILTEDVLFMDSKRSEGIQIADLIVGGLRHALRGGFSDQQRACTALGRLFFARSDESQALPLYLFTMDGSTDVDQTATAALQALARASRYVTIHGRKMTT